MINEIEFVCGAIASKDIVPRFKFLQIKDSFVTAYNGEMAIGSPIPFNIDCNPNAEQLKKVMCAFKSKQNSSASFSMTSAGKLRVKSSGLRATIDCYADELDYSFSDSLRIPLESGVDFILAISLALTFISDDATRLWSRGILCQHKKLYATNNVALVEIFYGSNLPNGIVIPKKCLEELVKRGVAPVGFSSSSNSITFYYDDESFIHTQLITAEWPKDPAEIINKHYEEVLNEYFPSSKITDALTLMSDFAEANRNVYFNKDAVRSNLDDALGTIIELPELGINVSQTIIFDVDVFLSLCGLDLIVRMRGDCRSIIFDNSGSARAIRAVLMAKLR